MYRIIRPIYKITGPILFMSISSYATFKLFEYHCINNGLSDEGIDLADKFI